jgi:hypothetical protein
MIVCSPPRPEFDPGSGQLWFVVDKAELEQVCSEYFGFPSHSLHRPLYILHHPPFGAGAIGQIVTGVPNGLRFTSLQEIKKKENSRPTCSVTEAVFKTFVSLCVCSNVCLFVPCAYIGAKKYRLSVLQFAQAYKDQYCIINCKSELVRGNNM